jgi:hypothetical protein
MEALLPHVACGRNTSSAGSMTPENDVPQPGQTTVDVSNPQLSMMGTGDLRNGIFAVQFGHSVKEQLGNRNFKTCPVMN